MDDKTKKPSHLARALTPPRSSPAATRPGPPSPRRPRRGTSRSPPAPPSPTSRDRGTNSPPRARAEGQSRVQPWEGPAGPARARRVASSPRTLARWKRWKRARRARARRTVRERASSSSRRSSTRALRRSFAAAAAAAAAAARRRRRRPHRHRPARPAQNFDRQRLLLVHHAVVDEKLSHRETELVPRLPRPRRREPVERVLVIHRELDLQRVVRVRVNPGRAVQKVLRVRHLKRVQV